MCVQRFRSVFVVCGTTDQSSDFSRLCLKLRCSHQHFPLNYLKYRHTRHMFLLSDSLSSFIYPVYPLLSHPSLPPLSIHLSLPSLPPSPFSLSITLISLVQVEEDGDEEVLSCVGGRSFRSVRERWWYIALSKCGVSSTNL